METRLWALRWLRASLAAELMEPMLGIAMAAITPMTEMTTSISTRLKPFWICDLRLVFFMLFFWVWFRIQGERRNSNARRSMKIITTISFEVGIVNGLFDNYYN